MMVPGQDHTPCSPVQDSLRFASPGQKAGGPALMDPAQPELASSTSDTEAAQNDCVITSVRHQNQKAVSALTLAICTEA